jgi:hypothetical protein
LLVGREDLGNDKIKDNEIENGEIEDDEEDIGIANCEKFFFNYIDRCAISVYSANLIINRIAIEIASIY